MITVKTLHKASFFYGDTGGILSAYIDALGVGLDAKNEIDCNIYQRNISDTDT